MAPTDADEKRKQLKAKLAEKTNGSHKVRKETAAEKKQKEETAKEKAAADAKAKAEKDAKIAKEKAERAARPPPPPSVWADESNEALQIGIHIGITCDGCGHSPPLFGKAMKCKDCPDFDLCEECYPLRLDRHREAVMAKAGMPGKGVHPPAHSFAPRKPHTIMTKEAVKAEIAAAEESEKTNTAKEELLKARAAARRQREADGTAGAADAESVVEELTALLGNARISQPPANSSIWRPSPTYAAQLPTPQGHPRVLGPVQ